MSRLDQLSALHGLAKNRPVIKDSQTTVSVSDEFDAQPIEEVVAEAVYTQQVQGEAMKALDRRLAKIEEGSNG